MTRVFGASARARWGGHGDAGPGPAERLAGGGTVPVGLTVGKVPPGARTDFVAIVHDLAARKRTEERLQLQVAALEAAANGILISGPRAGSIGSTRRLPA